MRPPNASRPSATARSHWLASVRSQGTTIASPPSRRDLLRDRLDRCGVAADQDEAAAFAREGVGHRRAHSLGRAGDDRDAAFEHQVHVSRRKLGSELNFT